MIKAIGYQWWFFDSTRNMMDGRNQLSHMLGRIGDYPDCCPDLDNRCIHLQSTALWWRA